MTEHDPQPPERPGAGAESPPAAGAGPSPRPDPAPAGAESADEATTRIPPEGAGGAATQTQTRPPPPPPPPPAAPRRRLQRSKQRRVLAGVAGGLGEYTGVDPVLFRVLFAVLTAFGGAGILLYLVGWLFLPDEDQATSPAESLIGRGRGGDAVQAVLLAVAVFALAGLMLRGDVGDLVLLLVVAAGGVLLARHLDERHDGTPPGRPAAPASPYQPYQAYEYQPYDPVPGATATAAGTAATATYPPVPPAPAKPPRKPSALGRIVLSVLLLVLGVTAALDAADVVDPQARHYLALSVGVLGLGLIVGAWRGRARALAWLGIPLTVALIAVSAAEVNFDGGAGDRHYRPLSVTDVRDRYEVGVGNLEVDLSDLDFTGRTVSTTASAGIGHVQVLVPREVDVEVVGRAGIGEADLFGEAADGTSPERTVIDQGPDGEGGGRLQLVLEIGVGKVEVDRAAA